MARYNPEIHHRRSIRLDGYDYRQDGMYFVTICTFQWECLLGEIVDGEMYLSTAGEAVQDAWDRLPARFPGIALDWFVVMPNHVHGILFLGADPGIGDARPVSLGAVVGAFKSLAAIAANRVLAREGTPLWYRNYYERIIRNDRELHRIRAYIEANPANWAQDDDNPAFAR